MSKVELWSFLEKNNCFIIKDDTTIITRCPFCGDSRKHLVNWGHLYINLEIPFFICFRCGERGHIKKVLHEFVKKGLCSTDHAKLILQSYNGKTTSFKLTSNAKRLIFNKIENQFNKQQEEYLIQRIGAQLDWSEYKIVAPKFLIENSNFMYLSSPIIDKLKQNRSFLSYFVNNFVGFVSLLNTFIIFRHIHPTEPRYIQVYTEDYDPADIYACNIQKPYNVYKHKKFIIAEGVFDVLNQRISLNKDNSYARFAISGKARFSNIHKIIKSYFVTPSDVVIYLDEDVKRNKFMLHSLKHALHPAKVTFLYNAIGKDIGEEQVKLKQIKL